MPRSETRAGPRHKEPARHDQHPAKSTGPQPLATLARGISPPVDLTAYRALDSWAAAAEHLNARGLAAAAPESVVPALRRPGLVVRPAAARPVA